MTGKETYSSSMPDPPMSAYTSCAGCGKTIPKVGAYHQGRRDLVSGVDERAYCHACAVERGMDPDTDDDED